MATTKITKSVTFDPGLLKWLDNEAEKRMMNRSTMLNLCIKEFKDAETAIEKIGGRDELLRMMLAKKKEAEDQEGEK